MQDRKTPKRGLEENGKVRTLRVKQLTPEQTEDLLHPKLNPGKHRRRKGARTGMLVYKMFLTGLAVIPLAFMIGARVNPSMFGLQSFCIAIGIWMLIYGIYMWIGYIFDLEFAIAAADYHIEGLYRMNRNAGKRNYKKNCLTDAILWTAFGFVSVIFGIVNML